MISLFFLLMLPRPTDLSQETINLWVNEVASSLEARYLFPERIPSYVDHIQNRLKQVEIHDKDALAELLTVELRAVSGDLHFKVLYIPNPPPERKYSDDGTLLKEQKFMEAVNNYGFEKLEILPGNVGYLKLTSFQPVEISHETATQSISYFKNCDGLILDLRNNPGGSPSLVQFLLSYFVEGSTYYTSFVDRAAGSTQQFWSLPIVPGSKFLKKPVTILTNKKTGSAAEGFSYHMKHMGRAKIVGEVTPGAAHRVRFFLNRDLNMGIRVPYAQPVSAFTGANWEGEGVVPDIAATSEKALNVAHLDILKTVVEFAEEPVKERMDYGINDLGYRYLYKENNHEKAIELFQLNCDLFPENFNTHDSLGEAYAQSGDKERALKCYRKALKLNPGYEQGQSMIKKLTQD